MRDLLEEEQQRYEKELEANFVISSSDRAEQLRRKADTIRSRRDEEVRNFVQEKLDQKWRHGLKQIQFLPFNLTLCN